MIDMLERHEVQVLRRPGHTWKEMAALRKLATSMLQK